MSEWAGLTSEESKMAVKAFEDAFPGLYGIAEAIDEMLRALAHHGVIARPTNDDLA